MNPIELNAAERKMLALLTAAAHSGAMSALRTAPPCGLAAWAQDGDRWPATGVPAAMPRLPEAGDWIFPRAR
jgi:hypothetical protein